MANLRISALPAASTPLAGTETLPIVQGGITEQVSVANLTAGRAVSATSLTANVVYTTALAASPATTTQNFYIYSSGGLNANAGIEWQYSASGSGYGFKQNVNGGTDTWDVGYRANSATWTRAFAVGNNGNATIDNGNLVIGTSGKGIDFSATSGAGTSELLADYEEGTWTPDQGSGLTVVGTFASSGTYTKVGRLVTITATLSATTIASTAGGTIFTNLPFNPAARTAGTSVDSGFNSSILFVNTTGSVSAVTAMAASGAKYYNATYYV